jgi:hypothetical protein
MYVRSYVHARTYVRTRVPRSAHMQLFAPALPDKFTGSPARVKRYVLYVGGQTRRCFRRSVLIVRPDCLHRPSLVRPVGTYVRAHARTYVRTYSLTHVRAYVRTYRQLHVRTCIRTYAGYTLVYVRMDVCTLVRMCRPTEASPYMGPRRDSAHIRGCTPKALRCICVGF